jgi:hypothetical protein
MDATQIEQLTREYGNTYYKTSLLCRDRQTQVHLQQAPQIATKRSKSTKAPLFREADESLGDCSNVLR